MWTELRKAAAREKKLLIIIIIIIIRRRRRRRIKFLCSAPFTKIQLASYKLPLLLMSLLTTRVAHCSIVSLRKGKKTYVSVSMYPTASCLKFNKS